MKTFLHISYDFSESKNADKTTAVGDLLKITNEYLPSKVISLDRTSNFFNEETILKRDDLLYLKVFGLPYGLFLKFHLKRVYKKILKASEKYNFGLNSVSVIHGHKLSYEGYIGYLLAKKNNAKLFVSLRQTDFRVYRVRPDLRAMLKEILAYSSKIFVIVPYMSAKLKEQAGEKFYKEHVDKKLLSLPNRIVRENTVITHFPKKGNLITALRIDKRSVKRKRIRNLFLAVRLLKDEQFTLNVIGDGPYLSNLKKWVSEFGIEDKVNFLGKINNEEMDKYYQESEAFILPSKSETFGLVYGEALVNETPILYTPDTGFDGFFENVGPKVNPDSPESIAEGIKDILQNSTFYRENIKQLKDKNAFRIFSPEYSSEVIEKALADEKLIEYQVVN